MKNEYDQRVYRPTLSYMIGSVTRYIFAVRHRVLGCLWHVWKEIPSIYTKQDELYERCLYYKEQYKHSVKMYEVEVARVKEDQENKLATYRAFESKLPRKEFQKHQYSSGKPPLLEDLYSLPNPMGKDDKKKGKKPGSTNHTPQPLQARSGNSNQNSSKQKGGGGGGN